MKKRIFLSILILPLLAYGGLKAYLWYNIKSSVDDAIASVAPFASITYGSIFSTLEGEVGVKDIRIQPNMTNDEFTVQAVSIRAESIFDFINVGNRFKKGEFPNRAGWTLQKLKLNLDSEAFRLLREFGEQAASAQPKGERYLFERLDALGCGDIDSFGLDEFIGMGYKQIEMDVSMDVEYRKISQNIIIALHVKDSDMYRADVDVQLALDIDKIRAGVMDPNQFQMTTMNMTYSDTGYFKLRNAFCAEQIGGTEAAYIDANIARLSAELGGELPPNVVKEYRNFMSGGGTIKVSLSPAEAIALDDMEFYETADVMRMLGLTMSVNGAQFDANQIQWKTASTKLGQKKAAIAKTQISSPASSKKAQVKPVPRKSQALTLQKVSVSQLTRYVGKTVQIDTARGKRRVGILESIDEERVRIKMRMRGGDFSFPVKIEEITTARVYR